MLIGHRDIETDMLLYDDDAYFTFNHGEISNMAAVQTYAEIEDPDNLKMLADLEEKTEPLSEELKAGMSQTDIDQFERNRGDLIAYQEHVRKRIRDMSPYDNFWLVRDTDYDNYLIQYTCQEFSE